MTLDLTFLNSVWDKVYSLWDTGIEDNLKGPVLIVLAPQVFNGFWRIFDWGLERRRRARERRNVYISITAEVARNIYNIHITMCVFSTHHGLLVPPPNKASFKTVFEEKEVIIGNKEMTIADIVTPDRDITTFRSERSIYDSQLPKLPSVLDKQDLFDTTLFYSKLHQLHDSLKSKMYVQYSMLDSGDVEAIYTQYKNVVSLGKGIIYRAKSTMLKSDINNVLEEVDKVEDFIATMAPGKSEK